MIGDNMKVNKRTYISKEQTDKLIKYFDELAVSKKEERQVIYTYHSEADFRLIKTKDYVTLDLKNNNDEDVVFIHKKYEKSRGVYQEIWKDLSFCTTNTIENLAKMIKNYEISTKYNVIKEKYCYNDNGDKLIEFINNNQLF